MSGTSRVGTRSPPARAGVGPRRDRGALQPLRDPCGVRGEGGDRARERAGDLPGRVDGELPQLDQHCDHPGDILRGVVRRRGRGARRIGGAVLLPFGLCPGQERGALDRQGDDQVLEDHRQRRIGRLRRIGGVGAGSAHRPEHGRAARADPRGRGRRCPAGEACTSPGPPNRIAPHPGSAIRARTPAVPVESSRRRVKDGAAEREPMGRSTGGFSHRGPGRRRRRLTTTILGTLPTGRFVPGGTGIHRQEEVSER